MSVNQDGHPLEKARNFEKHDQGKLASYLEYVCGCVLFQDVTVSEICGRYGAHFPYSPSKILK